MGCPGQLFGSGALAVSTLISAKVSVTAIIALNAMMWRPISWLRQLVWRYSHRKP